MECRSSAHDSGCAPRIGQSRLAAPQQGQSPRVIAHTWKAQHRLYKLYHRLHAKRPPQIAAVAVARELVGFLWSVMQELNRPVAQTT